MGGSGGGSLFGSFGQEDRKQVSCEDLRFRTAIISPDLSVLGTVAINEILTVELFKDEEDNPSVVVLTADRRELGFLLPTLLGRLIQCLEGGTTYQARITEIRSPRCTVDVYHA